MSDAQTPLPIGGAPVTTPESVEIHSPYDGRLLARVPACGPEQVDLACHAAAAALHRGDFPQHRRARVLEHAAELLCGRIDEFAGVIVAEAGKPLRTARSEVRRCVDTLIFAAAEARTLSGELIPLEASEAGAGKLGFALRVPVGVVAAITPFNFPLNLVAHKLAPAIAAGCPVVLKPAPQTPLSALKLVALLLEAGLPEDWISVVTDAGKAAGAALVAHPIPRLVTFTGSGPVGREIARVAADKRVKLELGSTAPLIVEPESDLDLVARKLRVAGFSNAGQSCISVQRVFVHASVAGPFLDALIPHVESLVLGDPSDEATEVGPLIREREAPRLLEWLDEAVSAGATILTGGQVREDGLFEPTVVRDVPAGCRLYKDEVFGPLVLVNTYTTFRQALAWANDAAARLHVGVFTNDLTKALTAARTLEFGGVLINEVPTWRADQQPYGGVDEGGNTREGPAWSVREMTELRFVSLQGF